MSTALLDKTSVLMLVSVTCLLALMDLGVGASGPQVTISQGTLKGFYEKTSLNKRKISAFLGIPYAQPPVGNLRFEAPLPAKPWSSTFDATKPPNNCMQLSEKQEVEGHEDCLYVNIYTPETFENGTVTPKYAVIAYVHGGGYMIGSGYEFAKPGFLLDQDLVLVTLNYRLGPMGFLSTEDQVVPGNNGLKDQREALRWIQKNIAAFGGNPNKVTLAGLSAGGSSVDYHTLSKPSRGLFHHGILESGSSLDPWARAEAPLAKAKFIAAHLDCTTKSTSDMIKCLKSKSGTDIENIVKLLMPFYGNPFSPFAPVIEPTNPTVFIDKDPVEILTNREAYDIPLLFNTLPDEGMYLGAVVLQVEAAAKEMDKQWNKDVTFVLDYNWTISSNQVDQVGSQIRKEYMGNKKVLENPHGFIQMVTDRLFALTLSKSARLHAQYYTSPVYTFNFTYVTPNKLRTNIYFNREKVQKIYGDFVAHGDSDAFVVGSSTLKVAPEVIPLIKRMTGLWKHFSTDHFPLDPRWKPLKSSLPHYSYYIIDDGNINDSPMVVVPNFANENFWNKLKLG